MNVQVHTDLGAYTLIYVQTPNLVFAYMHNTTTCYVRSYTHEHAQCVPYLTPTINPQCHFAAEDLLYQQVCLNQKTSWGCEGAIWDTSLLCLQSLWDTHSSIYCIRLNTRCVSQYYALVFCFRHWKGTKYYTSVLGSLCTRTHNRNTQTQEQQAISSVQVTALIFTYWTSRNQKLKLYSVF